MKDVNALITAAEKLDKTKYDRKAIVEQLRAELDTAAPVGENTETETTTEAENHEN